MKRLQLLARRLEHRLHTWLQPRILLMLNSSEHPDEAQQSHGQLAPLNLASSLDLSEAARETKDSSTSRSNALSGSPTSSQGKVESSRPDDIKQSDAKQLAGDRKATAQAPNANTDIESASPRPHRGSSVTEAKSVVPQDLGAHSRLSGSDLSAGSQSEQSKAEPIVHGTGSNHQKFSEDCAQLMSPGDRTRNLVQSASLFALAVLGFTALIGQRLYNQPALDVGKLAPQTIYAPRDVTVVDQKLTQERQREASLAAIPVLQVDVEQTLSQRNGLLRIFRHGNEIRNRLGSFPVVNPSVISSDVQRYVRQLSEIEWNRIRQEAKSNRPRLNIATGLGQKAIRQLNTASQRRGGSEFLILEQQLLTMRQQYRQAKALLQDADLTELNAAYSVSLFELSDREWEQLKVSTAVALERILAQGIAPGLAPKRLEQVIQLHLELAIPQDEPGASNVTSVAAPILRHVLKPNLVQDPIATQLQAEQAASNVQQAMVTILKDEAIVEAGQEIAAEQLVLLDEFELSQRRPNWIGLLWLGGIIWVEVSCLWLLQRRIGPRFRRRDWLVVGMVAATTPLLFALRLPMTSLPAVGLLVGSFYGSPVGVAVVGLLAIALPVGLELEIQALIASAASGIVGALVAGRLRSREELALLGLGVGLTQCIVHLLISLILSGATGLLWLIFLRSALSHALRGIAWSIVALGVSPYLERLFDLITPIRMAELSNPNRPLLQRLAKETPGTFQHTLFVSTLAEAAARALGCNVELIRAGTLYHDIGKMHDPQGFIENQMGGPNKHDLLNDPWQSAAIIKKHVTEGQVMARRCSLPRALQNFIPEHQGTMRISYFYQQAQKLAAEDPERYSVDEADFRYDGPTPQSRETGIVMLADSCEAALRSLKDATSDEALNMVKKIIRARWKDNQLCDSGLSKADLDTIAAVFVQIWQQFHHKRIPYPASQPLPTTLPSS